MAEAVNPAWPALWQALDALQAHARRLRHLAQMEPLLQARPDFPRARIGRSHAEEVRAVLGGIAGALSEMDRLVPQALFEPPAPAPVAGAEAPRALADQLAALTRLAASLEAEAFEPPPPLPAHAPPYLAAAPARDLAGSKAVLLSLRLEEAAAALRNALLAVMNAG